MGRSDIDEEKIDRSLLAFGPSYTANITHSRQRANEWRSRWEHFRASVWGYRYRI